MERRGAGGKGAAQVSIWEEGWIERERGGAGGGIWSRGSLSVLSSKVRSREVFVQVFLVAKMLHVRDGWGVTWEKAEPTKPMGQKSCSLVYQKRNL